ncbi:activator of Hsp90 ATPase [Hysterangium stoloniferum]|nr:activator of Hsp90 ATPase [Hysterangium stoloniferum]
MALPSSTANWHWKTKHVTPWARAWFEQELSTLTVKGDGDTVVTVEKVTEVDGDVELGQRKSKLITIYDCRIEAKWSGTASDGTEVSGTLTIPEVSHENTVDGLSDYVFNWTLTTPSSGPVNALYDLATTRLRTAIETKLAEFPAALIDTHGKDITVSGDPSRAGTPSIPNGQASGTTAAAAATADARAPAEKAPPRAQPLNTETVTVDASFQAAADDLFSLLTDEKRIPMWSRAPAQSKAAVGTEYSLFGGGVKGTYTGLTPGKEIVQTWALSSPSWPAGHVATLTTTLEQSSDSTKLVLSLAGVPKGMEDEIHRNLEGY